MKDVAQAFHYWMSRHGIERHGVKVTIEFPTEREAARAAFFVKHEFEEGSLIPDVRSPGLWNFRACGFDFELRPLSKD